MSLFEPRCLVCGSPLDRGAPFEKDVRNSEVCSDKCYEFYMHNEDDCQQEQSHNKSLEPTPDSESLPTCACNGLPHMPYCPLYGVGLD